MEIRLPRNTWYFNSLDERKDLLHIKMVNIKRFNFC